MKIFHLPDLGEGLAEAEIREWYVKVGDTVTVDQPLVSMETAKAIVDVPSPYAGKIAKLHGVANEVIKTGAALISFATSDKDKDKGSVVGKLEVSEKKWEDGDVIVGSSKTTSSIIKVMPAARVLAKEMQIDLNTITPTGPQGLITVADVKNQLTARHTDSLHGVRRVMAKTMTEAQRDVVPVTIFDDVDVTNLPEKADLTVILIQAMVAGAKKEPALNAWFDGKLLERKLFDQVHIGLAIDSPEGLFVPVIADAETRLADELRHMVDAHKQAVMTRRIAAAAMQGATITLSNFGTIAGRYATPIIVPPAVAIVACGRSREAAVICQGKIVAGRVLPLSLTFDHRAVTGGEATRFLGEMIKYIEAAYVKKI